MTNQLFPAMKAIILDGDKFLAIKQQVPDGTFVWDLPGGKVEYGESPYDTVIREVKEETQLDIDIIKPVGVFWFFRYDQNQVVCTTFLCRVINESQIDLCKNPAQEKITEFAWVTKDEFLTNIFTVSHESMKTLISKIEL